MKKKAVYVILKYRSSAFSMSYPQLHEVCPDRKTANARCKELNERAQYMTYEVQHTPWFEP